MSSLLQLHLSGEWGKEERVVCSTCDGFRGRANPLNSAFAIIRGSPPSFGLQLLFRLRRRAGYASRSRLKYEQICIRFLFASSRDIANGKRVCDAAVYLARWLSGTRIRACVYAFLFTVPIRSLRDTVIGGTFARDDKL